MINVNKMFLIIILATLFNTGCISTAGRSSDRPRIKDAAATLDLIPIGTSFETIRDNYFETVQFYEAFSKLDSAHLAMRMKHLCDALVYYTYEKNFEDVYNFFRMHPVDLFLNLEEGDLYGELKVAELPYIDFVRVYAYIFFSKDKKYKGYYSFGWCGGNTREELQIIKANLLKAGYRKLCDYGNGKWEDWKSRYNKPLNLPPLKLPLIQHLDK